MRRAICSLGLLAAIASLPVRAQEKFNGPELFPVANFNTWTYRVQGQDDRLVVTAFMVSDKTGDRYYRFEGRVRNQMLVSEHLSIRKDGVYRVRHDNVEIDPPLLICRFPPLEGETWKAEYKINDKKTTIVYTCASEEITFQNNKVRALVIRAGIAEVNGGIRNTCWYVPAKGLVKQVIEEGDNKIVLEQESSSRSPKSKGP